MKYISLIICAALFQAACSDKPQHTCEKEQKNAPTAGSRIANAESDSLLTENEIARYYLVIVDSGNSYTSLDAGMLRLSSNTGITIDTMGRYFDRKTNKIILPEEDEDEIYAGTYYPRRFPSGELSIEYLNYYLASADTNTMILVAGITETKEAADSLVGFYRKRASNTFVLPADIYIGCMH